MWQIWKNVEYLNKQAREVVSLKNRKQNFVPELSSPPGWTFFFRTAYFRWNTSLHSALVPSTTRDLSIPMDRLQLDKYVISSLTYLATYLPTYHVLASHVNFLRGSSRIGVGTRVEPFRISEWEANHMPTYKPPLSAVRVYFFLSFSS